MSSIPWAKSLVAVSAAVTIAATLLVPGASPTAAAPLELSPDQLVDAPGHIPCLDASPAEFRMLECRAEIVQDFHVPSRDVPALIASKAVPNCSAAHITDESPTVTGRALVSVRSRITSLSSLEGGLIQHGGALTVDSDLGWVSLGNKSGPAANTLNSLPGWDDRMTQALGTNIATGEAVTRTVPALRWGYYTYKPQTRQVDVMWKWVEPAHGNLWSLGRSSAIMSTQFPIRSGELFDVILADWALVSVPMTPAELEVCNRGEVPPEPLLEQPALRPPTGDTSLSTFSPLYARSPAHAPVLGNRAGTAPSGLREPQLVTAMSPAGITYDSPLTSSMHFVGGSEIGYWNNGSCSLFTARVGYGGKFPDARSRHDFAVWGGSVVDGGLQLDQVLVATMVPVPPDAPEVVGREHFQVDVRVAIPDGTDVVVLTVTRRDGAIDQPSIAPIGVIVAEPTLQDCDHVSGWRDYFTSAFTDPAEEIAVDMAGTPEEVVADPIRFIRPEGIVNGWACPNATRDDSGRVQTTVNVNCMGGPLASDGTVYDSGIGLHSPGSVTWKVPANCTDFSAGFAFEDTQFSIERPMHLVNVYRSAFDPSSGKTSEWKLGGTISLWGGTDANPVHWTDERITASPGEIRVDVLTDRNWWGHVNIIKPQLTCQIQGSTTAAPEEPPQRLLSDTLPISGMEWVRSTNFWGPAERDSSLGENAAGDGQRLAIGGVDGWGSGIGVAPSVGAAESQIDIRTNGRCDRVTAWVGIDDEVGRNGTVRFAVYADGRLVTRSEVKRGGDQPTFLSADVSGALVVTLGVDNAGDGNDYDHADWAEPKVRCEVGAGHPENIETSSAVWTDQVNFWGPIEKNMSLGEDAALDGRPMSIGSSSGWPTGISMAPGGAYDQKAFVELRVPETCHSFTAWVGIDDEVGTEGSVQFSVIVDGLLVTHSPIMRGGNAPHFLRATVEGASTLRLLVDNGGDDNRYDHANWADPVLYCG